MRKSTSCSLFGPPHAQAESPPPSTKRTSTSLRIPAAPFIASISSSKEGSGVVRAKGFVGGFPGSALPDFGEPLLRQVYAETTREAESIAKGLQEIVHCDLRIVLLHYAPIRTTVEGEPEGIHVLLGSDRLATPIAEYGADLVLHGHAHAGSFEGCIGKIPVYNVAVHVTGRDFWIFDLEGARGRSETRVEGPA